MRLLDGFSERARTDHPQRHDLGPREATKWKFISIIFRS